eukprot:Seg52.3 transcript_id=Seg52.3/GoldUCD/mRNA.D3Y31 product="putative protein KIAA1841-like" protein_id=Seg52.3/GoldUCD/D3Y31
MARKGTKYEDSLLSVSKLPIYKKQNTALDSDQTAEGLMDQQDCYKEWSAVKGSELRESHAKANIVIHVCDEAKNVKQDFSCPRDLLINGMKYFADYLSNDTDRWEDVDISVHCDVLIFDWLMKYVKQGDGRSKEPPMLEPSNVISILISSEFLKMDNLVKECISFCYENMSAIIATPCNMNCINDKLVTRIAQLFTHGEVEAIIDRKDKFKSKLFCKKLEELFSPKFGNEDCPSNASTLFRCTYCEKLLISKFRSKMECLGDRTIIDGRGNLSYSHSRDSNWDVNDYLLLLKSNVKTWRNVYWRIWGSINYLYCTRCEELFACTDYGSCSFHPQKPTFTDDENSEKESVAGYYTCCKATAIKFNPLNKYKGCTFRDHVVNVPSPGEEASQREDSHRKCVQMEEMVNSQSVLDQLLAHKDIVCVPPKQAKFKNENQYVTSILNPAKMVPPHITTSSSSNSKQVDGKHSGQSRYEMTRKTSGHVTKNRMKDYGDEEQSDTEDNGIVRVVINPSKQNKNTEDKSSLTWDVSLPVRLNQDLQREDDLRRMNELMIALSKSRLDENHKGETEKIADGTQENFTPGTYHRIEQQLRASIVSSRAQSSNNASFSTGSRQSRSSTMKQS